MNETPRKVFISYSREPAENRKRVRNLADSLVRQGVDAMIDDYEASPAETWQVWMKRQINESDFVLLVCTESYVNRVESDTDGGYGVAYESRLISNAIYESKQVNSRFIPVVFSQQDSDFILDEIKGWSFYTLGTGPFDATIAGGFQDLYRRITDQPKVVRPEPGQRVKLPPVSAAIRSTGSSTARLDHDSADAGSARKLPSIVIGEAPPEPRVAGAVAPDPGAKRRRLFSKLPPRGDAKYWPMFRHVTR